MERLCDTPGLIETGVISYDQVRARRERVTTVEHEGMTIRRYVGVYKNTERIQRGRATSLPSTGIPGQENAERSESDNSKASEVYGLPWREVWFRIPLLDVLRSQVDSDGNTPIVGEKELNAFKEKWGITDSDLQPDGGWWVAEIIDGVLVRIERNPAPFEEENELPYHNWHYKRRPGHIFGIGIYEQTERMQMALDAMVSGGLDATLKNVYPMYVFDQMAFDNRDGGPNDLFASEPYRAIPKKSGRSVKEAVEVFAPEGSVLQNALTGQTQYWEMIRDISGATAELEGVGGGGRKTATEISQVSSAALASVNFLNSRAEQSLLGPMLKQFVDYNQAYATPMSVIRVAGEDGQAAFVPISASLLRRGRVDVTPKGSSELTSRLVQGQATANVYSLLTQTGRLKDYAWIKLILRRMGINESVHDLAMTDEEFMQFQMQLAQAQAAAQGEQTEATVDNGQGPQQVPVGDGMGLLNQQMGSTLG